MRHLLYVLLAILGTWTSVALIVTKPFTSVSLVLTMFAATVACWSWMRLLKERA